MARKILHWRRNSALNWPRSCPAKRACYESTLAGPSGVTSTVVVFFFLFPLKAPSYIWLFIKPFCVNLIPEQITMPHSPYRKTVYPPIQDLREYRRKLAHHRASWEQDDDCQEEILLNIGELLVEHCDFVETKLDIKVPIHLLHGALPILVNRIADIACMRRCRNADIVNLPSNTRH